MKWIKLLRKISNQPMNKTQHDDVMVKLSDGTFHKLKLVFTDNGSKFYLELEEKEEDL